MWLVYAFGSALFAGLTSILAKCGIRTTDSNVATAIRTIVVLLFSWIMVFIVGSQTTLAEVDATAWIFLILSGFATGASWLCYFKALQLGNVNKVVSVDKSSIILTIILAFILLNEKVNAAKIFAVVMIGIGTYMMVQKKKVNPGDDTEKSRESKNSENSENSGKSEKTGLLEESRETVKTGETDKSAGLEKLEESGKTGVTEKVVKLKKDGESISGRSRKPNERAWLIYALMSAVFASLTTILGKIGISGVESNLGTAIRNIVVLIMAWVVVFVSGKQHEVRKIPTGELGFICASGLATGGSWLCYYKALKDGLASIVVPIDKLSILVTVAFSYFVFGEKLSTKAAIGLCLITAGTLLMIVA